MMMIQPNAQKVFARSYRSFVSLRVARPLQLTAAAELIADSTDRLDSASMPFGQRPAAADC